MEQLIRKVKVSFCFFAITADLKVINYASEKYYTKYFSNLFQESCFFASSLSATHRIYMYAIIKNWIIG